jgi:hypothetical protein
MESYRFTRPWNSGNVLAFGLCATHPFSTCGILLHSDLLDRRAKRANRELFSMAANVVASRRWRNRYASSGSQLSIRQWREARVCGRAHFVSMPHHSFGVGSIAF